MKTIFLIFNILFSFLALALPYERDCSQHKINNTKQFSSDDKGTEAGYCPECPQNDSAQIKIISQTQDLINNSIPKKCFLAMAVRGNQLFPTWRYNYCKTEKQSRAEKRQKFCMNKDYITAIHQAFERMSFCFDFDNKKEEEAFFLINHESGGILNVRSKYGARCLGQITEDYVNEINTIISTANKTNPHKHADIWTSALNKCPDLDSFLIEEMKYITCKSTQNPYTCLLYTFFGLEKSHKNLKERLNSNFNFMGTRKFIAENIKFSQGGETKTIYENFLKNRPIKKNEMLTVRATSKSGADIKWVIWDDSEFHGLYEKIDWTKKVNIQKKPLFNNEKDIETMFIYWSHNGGHSLSRDGFSQRVKKLKQNIARSCSDKDTSPRCQMREQIKNGQGVSSSLALKFFSNDIRSSYPSTKSTRRNEVANYVSNIVDSHDTIFPNKDSKNRETMVKYHEKNKINSEEAEAFQDTARQMCPKKINFK